MKWKLKWWFDIIRGFGERSISFGLGTFLNHISPGGHVYDLWADIADQPKCERPQIHELCDETIILCIFCTNEKQNCASIWQPETDYRYTVQVFLLFTVCS